MPIVAPTAPASLKFIAAAIAATAAAWLPRGSPLRAADETPATETAVTAKGVNRGMKMDYGPFLTYSVLRPRPATPPAAKSTTKPAAKSAVVKAPTKSGPKPPAAEKEGDPEYPWKPAEMLATKGVTVKVGKDAAMLFDTDTCRFAAGWSGGFLDVTQCNLGLDKGSLPAFAAGVPQFTTPDAPGWAKDDSFKDNRPDHRGPLPAEWARFKGLYRDGDRIVFAYTVGGSTVLDMPGAVVAGTRQGFTRTLEIDRSGGPMEMAVCETTGTPVISPDALTVTCPEKDGVLCVGLVGGERGAALSVDGSHVRLKLLTVQEPKQLTIVLAKLPAGVTADAFRSTLVTAAANPAAPSTHTHGGPARWNDAIDSDGVAGPEKDAYTLDTIRVPDKNPWNSWMRLTALDFFPDGRCAVSTWNGDVWIVSGINARLDKVTWKRFAAGLYEPLGLKIVDGVIYVSCRDALYRLRDLNHDGEADFYECFNNDATCSGNYHAFEFDLQTDREGNFYYSVCGNGEPLATKDHGCILKVSKDGSKLETYATGFRAPNGMAIGPDDQMVIGDNQGHWTPSSKINFVRKGGFYGFEGDPRKLTKADREYMHITHPNVDPPLCWVPYKWDTSSAGQVWAAGEKWGPLAGHLMHLSYGTCTMFEVMYETVDGVTQGGVVQLPFKFESGAMRARVNPLDGQIYVVGLKGWQTAGAKSGSLQRVRYTGKPLHLPTSLRVTDKGIYIGFACELEAETANDPESFGIEAFQYHRTSTYGSPDFKPSAPGEKGRDTIAVTASKLQPDKRTVLLDIPGLKPVEQMIIRIDLKAADGAPIKCEIGNTINKVGRDGVK